MMTPPNDAAITPITSDTVTLDDDTLDQIKALAMRQTAANGVLMKAINYVGGQVESGLSVLPTGVRDQIDSVARIALEKSFNLAAKTRTGRLGRAIGTDWMHRVLGTVSGAIGGVAGIGTALTELPFATTIIFRSVQAVAEEYGEDPQSAETRMECLAVFGSGGPGTDDDGVDTSFIGARLSITGPALNTLISKVAPRFATVMSQKLASQSVPILGAIAGAGTNYAFVNYYISMAHVHFGLRKLMREKGEDPVLDAFHRYLMTINLPINRASP
jgi:hypothetical protein